MQEAQGLFAGRGARVACVGQGKPGHAAAFRRRFGLTYPVYVDPDRSTYRAFGLARTGVGNLVHLFTRAFWAPVLRHWRLPYIGPGDERQLGGTVLVVNGRVRFLHASRHMLDNANLADVLAALG